MASVIQLRRTDGEIQYWAYSRHLDALKNAKALADSIAHTDYHCSPHDCWSEEYDPASGNYSRAGGLWVGVHKNVPMDQVAVTGNALQAAVHLDRPQARAAARVHAHV